MRTILELLLAIAFLMLSSKQIAAFKKEAITKVHDGLPSLSSFTKKMTSKRPTLGQRDKKFQK